MSGMKGENLISATYARSLDTINMAFVLAAVLAWNKSIGSFIENAVKLDSNASYYYIVYPLIVTFLAVLVFNFTQKFLKHDVQNAPVYFAATGASMPGVA